MRTRLVAFYYDEIGCKEYSVINQELHDYSAVLLVNAFWRKASGDPYMWSTDATSDRSGLGFNIDLFKSTLQTVQLSCP